MQIHMTADERAALRDRECAMLLRIWSREGASAMNAAGRSCTDPASLAMASVEMCARTLERMESPHTPHSARTKTFIDARRASAAQLRDFAEAVRSAA